MASCIARPYRLGCINIVMPERQGTALLYNGNYAKLAGHPRAKKMYGTVKQQFYWPHIPQDVDAYDLQCKSCL